MSRLLVIFEQDYDITTILDVIDSDKLDDYAEHYKKRLLSEPTILEIIETVKGEGYHSFKTKYSYEGNPEEWNGYQFQEFNGLNNFIKEEIKK